MVDAAVEVAGLLSVVAPKEEELVELSDCVVAAGVWAVVVVVAAVELTSVKAPVEGVVVSVIGTVAAAVVSQNLQDHPV